MANYYMQGGDGKEYGPVSAEQLRQWAAEGRANAQTQVRAENSAMFLPFGSVPELSGQAASPAPGYGAASTLQGSVQHAYAQPAYVQQSGAPQGDSPAQIRRMAAVIAAGSGWMKMLAVLMFLMGVGLCLTFIGIVVAWLPIWQGVNLWRAAERAKHAVFSGSEQDLARALEYVRRSYTLGVWIMAGLVIFSLLYVLMAVAVQLSGLGNLRGM